MSNSSLETDDEDDVADLLESAGTTGTSDAADPSGASDAADPSGTADAADPSGTADEGTDFAEQATEKVQLDTDDAMFLAEIPEPEEAPAVEKAKGSPEKAVEEPAKPLPRALIIGVLGVILICIAAIVWFIYFKQTTALSRVPASPTVVVVPNPKEPPPSTEMVATLAPFILEYRRDGQVDFLETQFALVVEGKALHQDILDRNLILRDAIYYYLLNQEEKFLFDPKNITIIKNALEGIVNGHLGAGKLKKFLIVQYLIR